MGFCVWFMCVFMFLLMFLSVVFLGGLVNMFGYLCVN